jgi:beta-glucosidase
MTATYWNNENDDMVRPLPQPDMREPINQSNGGATVFAPGVELGTLLGLLRGDIPPGTLGILAAERRCRRQGARHSERRHTDKQLERP